MSWSSKRPPLFLTPIRNPLHSAGNDAFANAYDAFIGSAQTHVAHYQDPVPHLPGETLGYQHPSGELWLNEPSTSGVTLPGQENDSGSNSVVFTRYDTSDHDGPYYGGVQMGTCY